MAVKEVKDCRTELFNERHTKEMMIQRDVNDERVVSAWHLYSIQHDNYQVETGYIDCKVIR